MDRLAQPPARPLPSAEPILAGGELRSLTLPARTWCVVEGVFARPVDDDVLVRTLGAKGVEARLDARPARRPEEDPIPWCSKGLTARRLLLRSRRPCVMGASGVVSWPGALPIGIEPDAAPREVFEPWFLRGGADLAIVARAPMRSASRRAVFEILGGMGFSIAMLFALRRERTPEGVSSTTWYARARWTRVSTIISPEDPLFFDTVQELRTP